MRNFTAINLLSSLCQIKSEQSYNKITLCIQCIFFLYRNGDVTLVDQENQEYIIPGHLHEGQCIDLSIIDKVVHLKVMGNQVVEFKGMMHINMLLFVLCSWKWMYFILNNIQIARHAAKSEYVSQIAFSINVHALETHRVQVEQCHHIPL